MIYKHKKSEFLAIGLHKLVTIGVPNIYKVVCDIQEAPSKLSEMYNLIKMAQE